VGSNDILTSPDVYVLYSKGQSATLALGFQGIGLAIMSWEMSGNSFRTIFRGMFGLQIVATELKGKVCFVTGASSGIGEATAMGLGALGASVVAVMRNQSPKAESAIKKIEARSRNGGGSVSAMYADLSSQSSIRQLAQDFDKRFDRLDVLINNAGVNHSKRIMTADGLESTFAVNVLAPFLLTNLLLGKLKASAPSRIVNVSSRAAGRSSIEFDNLQGERKYSMFGAYGQSKLALNLLTLEFARRLRGTGVTANFLHPGVVRTNLARDLNPIAQAISSLAKLFFTSPEQAARTSIYVASAPELEGVSGKYFSHGKEATAPRQSCDEATTNRLWQICEQLTGMSDSR
jgi:NAD(P)-dependent dehydrogenase (short-subunit alcohol dehydrogenase family)